MVYQVTRKEIIKALEGEILCSRSYFSPLMYPVDYYIDEQSYNGDHNCAACAVGSVLKNVKKDADRFDAGEVTNAYCNYDQMEDAVRHGTYMSILSCLFEEYCENNFFYRKDMLSARILNKDQKAEVIDYLTLQLYMNFPKRIEFETIEDETD